MVKNAEKFEEVFGIYATEVWAMPEADFLDWLNSEYGKPNPCDSCQEGDCYGCERKEE